MSAPLTLVVRLALTIALVWCLPQFLPQYIAIEGGIIAIVLIGITLTLLNLIARPILNAITFPFKLFATILAVVFANAAFLWLLTWLISMMNQNMVRLLILDGVEGWIVISLIVGFANWVMKEILN